MKTHLAKVVPFVQTRNFLGIAQSVRLHHACGSLMHVAFKGGGGGKFVPIDILYITAKSKVLYEVYYKVYGVMR